MFKNLEDWFFNSPNTWLNSTGDTESHVDRAMNVRGSGFQHRSYFKELAKGIGSSLCDVNGPKVIVDTGCGDGRLLATLAKTLSENGADRLNDVLFVGVDFNQEPLDVASETLTKIGVSHQMILGDVADPEGIIRTLKEEGIDPKDVLHVRSFLDHDRTFLKPQNLGPEDFTLSMDMGGNLRPAQEVTGSLVEHFERWSKILGPHGLNLIEVFSEDSPGSQPPAASPSLHFDLYQTLSGQMLVTPSAFWQCAAAAGLHAAPDEVQWYPNDQNWKRIAIARLEPSPIRIREA
ncbi:MAG: class I SAM-dependent methyltransferase, partial [Proteobacteria bacterium]|nr:class I SAM-dependent methyltransferase [Pseudomonadota bacterium]